MKYFIEIQVSEIENWAEEKWGAKNSLRGSVFTERKNVVRETKELVKEILKRINNFNL